MLHIRSVASLSPMRGVLAERFSTPRRRFREGDAGAVVVVVVPPLLTAAVACDALLEVLAVTVAALATGAAVVLLATGAAVVLLATGAAVAESTLALYIAKCSAASSAVSNELGQSGSRTYSVENTFTAKDPFILVVMWRYPVLCWLPYAAANTARSSGRPAARAAANASSAVIVPWARERRRCAGISS